MTEKEMWTKRHNLKSELKTQLTERQINLVDDLLELELLIERTEQSRKWFWQR